jgi:hypothetical protein
MQSIIFNSQTGKDGILHLDIPLGLTDTELKVTVTVEPITPDSDTETPQGKGWQSGFFEETFGSLKDNPLMIDSEGVFEDEEELT